MRQVFIDSDVLLDQLADRQPFQPYAAGVLALAQSGKIQAYTSPLVVVNIHYLLRRLSDTATASKAIENLLNYLTIIPISQAAIHAAIRSGFSDFEDALQHEAALESGEIEIILTRNTKDYKKAQLPIMTPRELLALLQL